MPTGSRHALPGEDEAGQHPLDRVAAPDRHGDPDRHPDPEGDQERAAGQHQRVGDAARHDVDRWHPLHDRVAEIEPQQVAEVVEILDDDRPVETEFAAQRLDMLARGALGTSSRVGSPEKRMMTKTIVITPNTAIPACSRRQAA
jgi:hypothetical protein